MEKCNIKIKTFVNNFGVEETQRCVLEKNHFGRCSYRPDYKIFGDDEIKIKNKLNNSAFNTAGETAKNSPIKNRALRWNAKPISMKEEYELKKESKFQVGIRKDEAAPFEDCSKIEQKLYSVIKKVYNNLNDETTCCLICGEQFKYSEFLLGAKEPNSIQLCHEEPLNEDNIMHNEDNCSWGHRQCNSMQGNHSIISMMMRMEKIVEYQNKKKEENHFNSVLN
jgi:hypothetical protein